VCVLGLPIVSQQQHWRGIAETHRANTSADLLKPRCCSLKPLETTTRDWLQDELQARLRKYIFQTSVSPRANAATYGAGTTYFMAVYHTKKYHCKVVYFLKYMSGPCISSCVLSSPTEKLCLCCTVGRPCLVCSLKKGHLLLLNCTQYKVIANEYGMYLYDIYIRH